MQANIVLNSLRGREKRSFLREFTRNIKNAVKLPIINYSRGCEITKRKLLDEIDNRSIIGVLEEVVV